MIQARCLRQKPADLDPHCLLKKDISGFIMTRVNFTFSKLSFNLKNHDANHKCTYIDV